MMGRQSLRYHDLKQWLAHAYLGASEFFKLNAIVHGCKPNILNADRRSELLGVRGSLAQ